MRLRASGLGMDGQRDGNADAECFARIPKEFTD
jgi:hypothetical protein